TRAFERRFVKAGIKCWLIRTNKDPSTRLKKYLENVPEIARRTSTCDNREPWWKFTIPEAPAVLVATGFSGARPKAVRNAVGAVAVGSVSGVHGIHGVAAKQLVAALARARFRS